MQPDNVLIGSFMSAKVSDFGTSRAKDRDDATMTGVGTPLFVAPEVARGEEYDESCDVYSFGLTLLDMAIKEDLTGFIGSKWCAAFGKKRAPNPHTLSFQKVLRPVWEDGWRPVSEEDPLTDSPPLINRLIVQSCAEKVEDRPTFSKIVDMLLSECKAEIDSGDSGGSAFKQCQPTALLLSVPSSDPAICGGSDLGGPIFDEKSGPLRGPSMAGTSENGSRSRSDGTSKSSTNKKQAACDETAAAEPGGSFVGQTALQFLRRADLEMFAAALAEQGFSDVDSLSDRELLDDELLTKVIGMDKIQIRKLRERILSEGTNPTMKLQKLKKPPGKKKPSPLGGSLTKGPSNLPLSRDDAHVETGTTI